MHFGGNGMTTYPLIHRLRIYINYGASGFLITLLLLFVVQEPVMLLLPIAFNLFLRKKLLIGEKKQGLLPALLIGLLTTGVFLIQHEYRQKAEWGCIRLTSDEKAFVSYAYNLIFFSVILWEVVIGLLSMSKFGAIRVK
jgi:hypothetical protein